MADDATVIRLLTFRTSGAAPALDVALRSEALPDLESVRGLVDAWAGRHGATDGDRVIVTTWRSRREMDATFGGNDVERLIPDQADEVVDAHGEAFELAFGFRIDRAEPARLLRVFRGTTSPNELDAYVAEARAGALRDARSVDGLLAIYLGIERPTRFVTVSVWTDWSSIEEATGATVRAPATTRNTTRLVTASASHFEVLPGTEQVTRPGAVAGTT